MTNKYCKGWNDAIKKLKEVFRTEYEEMMEQDIEDCINWADWLDSMAEELKGENNE